MFSIQRRWSNLVVIGLLLLSAITQGQTAERIEAVSHKYSKTLRRRQHEPSTQAITHTHETGALEPTHTHETGVHKPTHKHEPVSPSAKHTNDHNHNAQTHSVEDKNPHVTHSSKKHGEGKHHARPKHDSDDTEGFEENHFFSDFAPHGSIFFYMFTTITATLNICASSAVIYISYIDYQEIKYRNQEKAKKPHLSSSIRFPFYIAILDLFLGCITLFMVADTMYWDELPSSRTCAVIGGIIYLGTFIEMTVVGTVAVVTYLQLVQKVDVYLGKWDWKVWVGCGVSCLGTAIAGVHTRGFGPDLYWCLVNEHTYSGHIFLKLFLSVHYVVLFIVLVCYLLVLHDMIFKATTEAHLEIQPGRVKRTLSIHSNHRYSTTIINAVQKHRKHTENLGIALFLHVFHFTPAIVHMILQLKGYHRAWVYVVAAAFLQLGGVLNGVEVFMHRKPVHPKWKQRVEDTHFEDDSKLAVNEIIA